MKKKNSYHNTEKFFKKGVYEVLILNFLINSLNLKKIQKKNSKGFKNLHRNYSAF